MQFILLSYWSANINCYNWILSASCRKWVLWGSGLVEL